MRIASLIRSSNNVRSLFSSAIVRSICSNWVLISRNKAFEYKTISMYKVKTIWPHNRAADGPKLCHSTTNANRAAEFNSKGNLEVTDSITYSIHTTTKLLHYQKDKNRNHESIVYCPWSQRNATYGKGVSDIIEGTQDTNPANFDENLLVFSVSP